jgi:hypothetical protein
VRCGQEIFQKKNILDWTQTYADEIRNQRIVIPAKAGIHELILQTGFLPEFILVNTGAGMTEWRCFEFIIFVI